MIDIDEIDLNEKPEVEFFLGTVVNWQTTTGVRIKIDGQDSYMTKSFKMLMVSRPLPRGARVLIMKHSGTYIVLGEISNPKRAHTITKLSGSVSITAIIPKINEIIDCLKDQGISF